jgi:hypothetical protein
MKPELFTPQPSADGKLRLPMSTKMALDAGGWVALKEIAARIKDAAWLKASPGAAGAIAIINAAEAKANLHLVVEMYRAAGKHGVDTARWEAQGIEGVHIVLAPIPEEGEASGATEPAQ